MSKVVQYDGVLYSLSNRRLFVMRVVANLTRGGITCRVDLFPGDHPRVQAVRYDYRLGKEETKWGRAFSTRCNGSWVHVYSKYRWRQEPPVASIRDERISENSGEHGTTEVKEVQAEPRVEWQMLFEVVYGGGEYATVLARLCREYGVVGTSSRKYKVQGLQGKEFRLVFFEQPQLEPDAEQTDFPLSVWATQDRVSGADVATGERDAISEQGEVGWVVAVEGGMDTQQDAGLDGLGLVKAPQCFEIFDLDSTVGSDHDPATPSIAYSDHDPATPSTADSDHDAATPSTASSEQGVVSVDAAEAADERCKAKRKRWNKIPEGNCDHVNVGTVKKAAGPSYGSMREWRQLTSLWMHD